ncbi:MAG: hypothetical protein KJP23_28485, partial [Deltaproteobacteria bacterium]|nr:hypothetical protein [Deltaproteobacteria bacterium]
MEKQHKFSIWYVLLGVWIVLIIQNLIVSMLGIKTIPYSEFLRLDRNILVDRPDKDGRAAILKVHLKNIKTEGHLDVEVLAGMTSGMVGADLANL